MRCRWCNDEEEKEIQRTYYGTMSTFQDNHTTNKLAINNDQGKNYNKNTSYPTSQDIQ